MKKRRTIPTQLPIKEALVPGHHVYAVAPKRPAVPGRIIRATAAAVTVEVDPLLAVLGLPRRSVWTWRRGLGRYIQRGARTDAHAMYLVLDNRAAAERR